MLYRSIDERPQEEERSNENRSNDARNARIESYPEAKPLRKASYWTGYPYKTIEEESPTAASSTSKLTKKKGSICCDDRPKKKKKEQELSRGRKNFAEVNPRLAINQLSIQDHWRKKTVDDSNHRRQQASESIDRTIDRRRRKGTRKRAAETKEFRGSKTLVH